MRCAVRNCGNNNEKENKRKWRYFRFPKYNPQLVKWIEFCDRDALNPLTACICNEHFKLEDFERNMQYEFGFSQKNPTILKTGSCPTLKRPETVTKSPMKKRRSVKRKEVSNVQQEVEVELCDFATDLEGLDENSTSVIQQSKETDFAEDQLHYQLEFVEASANSMDEVEIIDTEDATYVRHLEHEVTSLRREVFNLKDDRKKLLEVIQNLKETIRGNSLLREESAD
ncbi:uncharacterized protein LOC117580086 [Drosophila guanche]|uniref:THAP-type domain-containing protein n=1 Tax=Drosophila guanche TaxID=7266 RepID=A0A3B0J4J9_DROGU|nr:uncharacterized protein LOC117580086 [Drosophila guanche]SPP76774.1 Hypothetical predicted protein [Drosophila guanche]